MHSIRLSTSLFTDGLFPVATIETDTESRLTTVSGGKLDGQQWNSENLVQSVARHRAIIGRAIRAEMDISGERWEALGMFDEEKRWGVNCEDEKAAAAEAVAQEQ